MIYLRLSSKTLSSFRCVPITLPFRSTPPDIPVWIDWLALHLSEENDLIKEKITEPVQFIDAPSD